MVKARFLELWSWLKIRQFTIYYAGLLGRWSKWIVDQASDVPSIIFLSSFLILGTLKTLYFYFCNFIKKIENKLKGLLQRILQEFMKKKIILGTSDAWSMIHLAHHPSNLAYYIVDWRISVKGQPPRVTVALARPQMSGHEGRKINVLYSSTQSIFQGTTTLIYL